MLISSVGADSLSSKHSIGIQELPLHPHRLDTLFFEDVKMNAYGPDLPLVPAAIFVPAVVIDRLLHAYGVISL